MVTTNKVKVGETTTGTSTSTTASQWQTYNYYKAEQGWECPRCRRINAPWVRQCDCPNGWNNPNDQNNPTITWTSPTLDTHENWWKTHVTCGQADSNTYTTAENPVVGGSDYWNPTVKEWKNVDVNTSNAQSNSTTYPPNCHTFNYSTPTKGD